MTELFAVYKFYKIRISGMLNPNATLIGTHVLGSNYTIEQAFVVAKGAANHDLEVFQFTNTSDPVAEIVDTEFGYQLRQSNSVISRYEITPSKTA